MRKPLIAGNWKMYGSTDEIKKFLQELFISGEYLIDREIVICPPFNYLHFWKEINKDKTFIKIGGQDVYWETKGAYTGEISPQMLKDVGCTYCIIGHSERRKYFGETNESVAKKLSALFDAEIIPIVCVGETLEEREKGITENIIKQQVLAGILSVSTHPKFNQTVIAYEPVWAIGTGKTATSKQANEVISLIRNILKDADAQRHRGTEKLSIVDCRLSIENSNNQQLTTNNQDNSAVGSYQLPNYQITKLPNHLQPSAEIRILYGGSVKPDNIDELMAEPEIDGALVGGASLSAKDFARIVAFR